MNTAYIPLFTIALQHEFSGNRPCTDFELVPAPDCLEAFRKAGILSRPLDDRFVALIRANSRQEPALNAPGHPSYRADHGQRVFRFHLRLKQPLFVNYTNLPPDFGQGRKYVFSNGAANGQNGQLPFQRLPLFAADKPYVPGDLVREARSGTVFEALKKSAGKKKPVADEAGVWAAREAAAYASEADLLEYTAGVYLFPLPAPVSKAAITITGFNFDPLRPAYDRVLQPAAEVDFSQPLSVVPVRLEGLPPGKYQVGVNGDSRMVYYDPLAAAGNIAGVIEIFNHLPGTDPYALLTGEEQVRSPQYTLLFPARRVLWKYIRKDGRADAITDLGETRYKFTLKGDEFVSAQPIPLLESPLKTLKLQFNTADFQLFPLPNPGVDRLRRCEQDDFEYYCAEVALNY